MGDVRSRAVKEHDAVPVWKADHGLREEGLHHGVVDPAGYYKRADPSVHGADREDGVPVLTYLLMTDERTDVRRSPAVAAQAG